MKKRSKSSLRLNQADRGALAQLDHLLEEERRIEQRYALPFRAPHRVATSVQPCVHCGGDLALMIFGDNASDEAGLEAYARMMGEPIQRLNLPTYVIAPPADRSSIDNPTLLLKVHPVREAPCLIVPDEWDSRMAELSQDHCRKSGAGKVSHG